MTQVERTFLWVYGSNTPCQVPAKNLRLNTFRVKEKVNAFYKSVFDQAGRIIVIIGVLDVFSVQILAGCPVGKKCDLVGGVLRKNAFKCNVTYRYTMLISKNWALQTNTASTNIAPTKYKLENKFPFAMAPFVISSGSKGVIPMQVRGEKSTPQGLQKGPNSEPQGQGAIQQQQQHPCNDATYTFGDFIRKLTSSETILQKSHF